MTPSDTQHRVHFQSSSELSTLAAEDVHLVVTSPPYPMIEMWDDGFAAQSPAVSEALAREDGPAAFERMHETLDPVWSGPGGVRGSARDSELPNVKKLAKARHRRRLEAHREFVLERRKAKGVFGYPNETYGFPVVTKQERQLVLSELTDVERTASGDYRASYGDTVDKRHIVHTLEPADS